jgi:hypothetical protein
MSSEEKTQEIAVTEAPFNKHRKKPFFDPVAVKAEFQAMSRAPFTEVLTELMQCVPTPDKIQEFANSYPDRWANAIKSMASLSGFHEKMEVSGNINVEVHNMGDAELLVRLKKLNQQLDEMGISSEEKPIIDIVPDRDG